MPSSDLLVANTIRSQIGSRALFMFGASNFLGDASTLTFKVGRNAKGVTHVRVTLTVMDTYTIEFIKVRGMNLTTLATREDIYNDSLVDVIANETGLRSSL